MSLVLNFGLSLLVILTIIVDIKCSRLTPEEADGLQQLRQKLDHILYEPYMKTDFYLINFLRVNHNDITAAAEMLTKTQNWRVANRMDSILNETYPWKDLLKSLPYRTDGVDRYGSPLIEIPAGIWDVRRIVLAGKGDLYVHHLARMFEDTFQKIRLANAKNSNVTQWQILFELSGYNTKLHACLACIPRQIQFVVVYENNYPLRMKRAWMINTPRIFENLLNILKTFMAPETQEALELHGHDKSEWLPKLKTSIDPSQLLGIFGGTKI